MEKVHKSKSNYIRNFVFGVEDSLVSTVGLLSGVAVAGLPRAEIFLTGIILIFVEAFSMGVGSYLSESAVRVRGSRQDGVLSLEGGLIMFFSYFAAGFIPLSPYIFIENNKLSLPISICFSLLALLVLGLVSGRMVGSRRPLRQGFRMFVLGGLAIAVGALVGFAF
jgi:VIT1/CCC1 family predicted Fe2+/Mn2+ transporter